MKIRLLLVSIFMTLGVVSCSNDKTFSEKKLKEITNAFYQQSFVDKGITDDSSFCGTYEPRNITIDSFLPLYNYGVYGDGKVFVLTFAINGFYTRSIELRRFKVDGKTLSFPDLGYWGEPRNEYLIPQVYVDGHIYDIITAYEQNIITPYSEELFTKYTTYQGNTGVYLAEKGEPLSEFSESYFKNLPALKNKEGVSTSLLTERYETIKDKFYQKYIINKGLTDDSSFRETMDTPYREDVKAITKNSIHLNEQINVTDDMLLYTVSVNDIIYNIQPWFHDHTSSTYMLGEFMFSIDQQIEPIVEVNNEVYYLTDAYEEGLISEDFVNALRTKHINVISRENIQLECKYKERTFIYN